MPVLLPPCESEPGPAHWWLRWPGPGHRNCVEMSALIARRGGERETVTSGVSRGVTVSDGRSWRRHGDTELQLGYLVVTRNILKSGTLACRVQSFGAREPSNQWRWTLDEDVFITERIVLIFSKYFSGDRGYEHWTQDGLRRDPPHRPQDVH